jgi:hypothetical protein
MSESARSDRGPASPKTKGPVSPKWKDSFGLWLGGQAGDAGGKAAGAAKNGAGTPPDVAALRAFRAGKGPLASVVSSLDAGCAALDPPTATSRKGTATAAFTPLKRPAAVSLVTLMALAVAAGYAVRDDLRKLSALRGLEKNNESIHEYNYSRNVLVRNLAKDGKRGKARLKGYNAWMGAKSDRGVIVFTPEGGQAVAKRLVDTDFPDDGPPLANDVETAGNWTPPAPLKDYDEFRFETAELLASRLPVAAVFAVAVASVIVWSVFASRNLTALDAPALCTRPPAVLACWLAPVGNLYLPCAVMGDIWQGSDPRSYGRPRRFRLPVVGLWWLTLLGASILLAFAASRMATAIGPMTMVSATRYALYADLGAIAVAVLTLGLVVTASWNQSRRYRLVVTSRERLGPAAAWRRD